MLSMLIVIGLFLLLGLLSGEVICIYTHIEETLITIEIMKMWLQYNSLGDDNHTKIIML